MPTDPCCNPSFSSSKSNSSSSWSDGSSAWSSHSSSPSSMSSMSSSSSSCSWSSLASGLCTGAIAGAALALLYAPMRGSEARSALKSYASDGSHRLQGLIESGRCMAEDAIHQAASLIEEGRRAFQTSSASSPSSSSYSSSSSAPLTASIAEISGLDRRFEEPLGG